MRKKSHYLYIFLFAFVLVTTVLWAFKIMHGTIPVVDQWSRGFVEAMADSDVYFLFRWLTELGSGTFLTPFTMIMAILLGYLFRDWFIGVMFAGGTLLSYGLNVLIKVLVERERPRILVAAEAEGYSFPSGHAMISMVCYGLVVYFISKKIRSKKLAVSIQIGTSILIFLIGFSRYMISVHYLTDVLAGFVFGLLFVFLWTFMFEKINKKRSPSED
ncbi:hypothetical protein CFK37_00860 [Virgibacillus phasianinus]|uniref:Phosphatidic acid phosphatase type 2/haloperoxidase domain-containing protein n=1 Tax=Virgibacillus phasianinus TaxID=2017483 RepID=A0A220TYM2_9BACI|nr:phosphatase PAP2 family protein [Virgibacillus phasianinus]ASK60859.1 hypothetical protein CFK37_00860 [Virgibacillus phasianinus]